MQQLHVGKNEKVIWQLMKHENLAFQQIILQNEDLIKTLSYFLNQQILHLRMWVTTKTIVWQNKIFQQ